MTKKRLHLFASLYSTTIFSHKPTDFYKNFENASLEIGQTVFSSQYVGRTTIVTYGPLYIVQ
jgi:hypothetical protein